MATRKRHMVPVLIVLLIIGAGGGILAAYRIGRPLPALAANFRGFAQTPAQTVAYPWPTSNASIIGDANGNILGEGSAATVPRPIASVAKLITILTVLKKYPLQTGEQGPTITLGDTDAALYNQYVAANGSTVKVVTGEQLTEYQMLEAMLLPSANNVADSLAIWAFGSLDAYRTQAIQTTTALGMTDTTVGSDASGFSDSTTSTAADLYKLGVAAYAQPVIRQIAALQSATLPVAGVVSSTNFALGLDGITGLKTGTGDTGNNNLVFSADHTFADGSTGSFIGVVLGSASETTRFSEARAILQTAYASYTLQTPVKQGQIVGTLTSAWGQSTDIVASADLKVLHYAGSVDTITPALHTLNAAAQNQTVGTIKDGTQSINLQAAQAITGPSLWWRLVH